MLFLLSFFAFNKDKRQLYIPEKYYINPSQFCLPIFLFASNSRMIILNFAFFLYKALQAREREFFGFFFTNVCVFFVNNNFE